MAGRKEWDQVRCTQKYIKFEIDPIKLLPVLQGADTLTQTDCESIKATCALKGPSHATQTELLPRLSKRGSAAFPTFVAALRETGHDHAAQLLDPTYQGKRCKMFQLDIHTTHMSNFAITIHYTQKERDADSHLPSDGRVSVLV